MNQRKSLNNIKGRRVKRNRARIFGTTKRPRLAVSRSNRFIYAQLIDDAKSRTITHISSAMAGKEKKTKTEAAKRAGELLGKRAVELGIKEAIFDRRSYKYHGRVKALADGARSAGLKI